MAHDKFIGSSSEDENGVRAVSNDSASGKGKSHQSSHDVFISYSSKNKNVADAIASNFEQHGIKCWYAPRDIMPGEEWPSSIKSGIEDASILVLIYTNESNNSKHVMNEVAMAFGAGKTIVPFKLSQEEMNSNLEYYLTRVHWLDALTDSLSDSINELREYIEMILKYSDNEKVKTVAQEREKQRRTNKFFKRILIASLAALLIAFSATLVLMKYKDHEDLAFFVGQLDHNTYTNQAMGAKAVFSNTWKVLSQKEIEEQYGVMGSLTNTEEIEWVTSGKRPSFMAVDSNSGANINVVITKLSLVESGEIESNFDDICSEVIDSLSSELVSFCDNIGYEDITFSKRNIEFLGKEWPGYLVTASINGVKMFQRQVEYLNREYLFQITATSYKVDLTQQFLDYFTLIYR